MPEMTTCTTPDCVQCRPSKQGLPHADVSFRHVHPKLPEAAERTEPARLTAGELQAKVDAILAEFPALKAFDPAGSCCSGCIQSELGRGLGWDAADAWEELQSYYFLQTSQRFQTAAQSFQTAQSECG